MLAGSQQTILGLAFHLFSLFMIKKHNQMAFSPTNSPKDSLKTDSMI